MAVEAVEAHGRLVEAVVVKAVVVLAAMTEICGLVQTAVQAAQVQVAGAEAHFTTAMHLLVVELLNRAAPAAVAL